MAPISVLLIVMVLAAALFLSGFFIVLLLWLRSRAWRTAAQRTGLVYDGHWNGRAHLLGAYQGRRTGLHLYYHNGPFLRMFAWMMLADEALDLELDFLKAKKLAPETFQKTLGKLRWAGVDLVDGELGFKTAGLSSLAVFWSDANRLISLVEWLTVIAAFIETHSGDETKTELGVAQKKRGQRSRRSQKNLEAWVKQVEARGFGPSRRSDQIYVHPAVPGLRLKVRIRVVRLEHKTDRWELLESFSIARETSQALDKLDQEMAARGVPAQPIDHPGS